MQLVAISADPPADSQALRERLGIEFPLLYDEGIAVIRAYGVAMDGQDIAVPSVFVVRPDRTIAWRYVGESAGDRPAHELVLEQLDRLLE